MKLNYRKQGMRPKGSSDEWYTIEVGRVLALHVHNFDRDNWECKVTGLGTHVKGGFTTKELAADWGREWAAKLLSEAMASLKEQS